MNRRIHVSDLMTEEYQLKQMGDYSPSRITVGEETGFVMVDNNQFIMPKEKFLEFMKRAELAYNSDDIEAFIEFHNFKTLYPEFDTLEVDGKHILPAPYYYEAKFRKDIKKHWGFKCAWCDEKVSSKTDESYIEIRKSLDTIGGQLIEGRFCQPACAENYWYESVIHFVMDKKMTDYIHTDKRVGLENG